MFTDLVVFLLGIEMRLSRMDFALLPDQHLMETLVCLMSKQNQKEFKDQRGNFLDIEEWNSVVLNADHKVTKVAWSDQNLGFQKRKRQGTICINWLPNTVEVFGINERGFKGTMDCARLPPMLIGFHAERNFLNGSLNLLGLPEKLTEFAVSSNEFSGTIELTKLPPVLEAMDLSENYFRGSLDLTSLPRSMEILDLSTNSFSGTVCLEKLPKSMLDMALCENNLTGDIYLNSLPPKMRGLSLRQNVFDGSLVVIDIPKSLTHLRIGLLAKKISYVGADKQSLRSILHEAMSAYEDKEGLENLASIE